MSIPYAGPSAPVTGRVGPCEAGLTPGTIVLTLDGALPVEFLAPGDRIITRRGMRTLKAVVRHYLPKGTRRIAMRQGALGGKPSRETVVMPGQRVLVRDWRARALWGRDVAAPAASRLVDGEFIRWVQDGPQIMLSLYFGQPEVIYADGLELGSSDKVPARSTASSKG